VDRRFLRFPLVGGSNGAVTIATYSLLLNRRWTFHPKTRSGLT
jgi:putative flippase GtrA